MAKIDDDNNWMSYKNIYLAPWYEKYTWSYYWSTTIMLTVGFGDITASTYKEALMVTLAEMISCIVLAYNINCVGTLISNIRSQDL
jgi:DMSO reductase anchor subunit